MVLLRLKVVWGAFFCTWLMFEYVSPCGNSLDEKAIFNSTFDVLQNAKVYWDNLSSFWNYQSVSSDIFYEDLNPLVNTSAPLRIPQFNYQDYCSVVGKDSAKIFQTLLKSQCIDSKATLSLNATSPLQLDPQSFCFLSLSEALQIVMASAISCNSTLFDTYGKAFFSNGALKPVNDLIISYSRLAYLSYLSASNQTVCTFVSNNIYFGLTTNLNTTSVIQPFPFSQFGFQLAQLLPQCTQSNQTLDLSSPRTRLSKTIQSLPIQYAENCKSIYHSLNRRISDSDQNQKDSPTNDPSTSSKSFLSLAKILLSFCFLHFVSPL
eukprot:Sdes_comp18575_c0_seq1m8690